MTVKGWDPQRSSGCLTQGDVETAEMHVLAVATTNYSNRMLLAIQYRSDISPFHSRKELPFPADTTKTQRVPDIASSLANTVPRGLQLTRSSLPIQPSPSSLRLSACPTFKDEVTHLATSSAPNSFLHFSHPSHITLARSTSNFRALKNRKRCWSVNRSYPGPGLILSSVGVVGMRFCDSRRARNWERACCCAASLKTKPPMISSWSLRVLVDATHRCPG